MAMFDLTNYFGVSGFLLEKKRMLSLLSRGLAMGPLSVLSFASVGSPKSQLSMPEYVFLSIVSH